MNNNEYYHAFQVGFNWWMIVMAIAIAVMIFLGKEQYEERGSRIRRIYGEKLLSIVAAVWAVVWTVMVAIESISGVIQLFDNSLAGDSPVYSVLFAPIAIGMAGLLFWLILLYIGKIAGWAYLGYLKERRWERRKSRA